MIGLKLKSPNTGALITVDDLTSPILVSMPVVRMAENQIKPVQAPEGGDGDVGAVVDAATQKSNGVTSNITKLVRSCRVGVIENISLVCPSSDVATTEWHVTTKTNISPKVSLAALQKGLPLITSLPPKIEIERLIICGCVTRRWRSALFFATTSLQHVISLSLSLSLSLSVSG